MKPASSAATDEWERVREKRALSAAAKAGWLTVCGFVRTDANRLSKPLTRVGGFASSSKSWSLSEFSSWTFSY